jgi:hypothetical protein
MKKSTVAVLGLSLFAMACSEAPTAPMFLVAPGGGNTTTEYTGNGWTNGALNNEFCSDLANDGSTGQGVDINAGYLLWVLTANGASGASLYLPDGTAVDMIKVGGTFKYASAYYTQAQLVGAYSVHAGGKGKATLTVSHGCRGQTQVLGFCSPGFWRQNDAAWNTLGFPPPVDKSSLFSATVQPFALVPSSLNALAGKSLNDVFGPPPIQSPVTTYNFGGGVSFNANLGPFNAVGAYLTTLIPLPDGSGYFTFDPAQVGTSDHYCPLNADGSYKPLPE